MYPSFLVAVVTATIVGQALASPGPFEPVEGVGPELVHCFNSGTKSDYVPFVGVIDEWCRQIIGKHLANGQQISTVFHLGGLEYWMSAKAINGCSFTIDGSCNRLLRLPVDQCNTGNMNGKQGGIMTDPCGEWVADPGRNGSPRFLESES